jgi:hypothetical protein
VGLGSVVYGVLRSSEWGWVDAKPGAPTILGASPAIWLLVGGLLVVWLFLMWEERLTRLGREPLLRLELFGNAQLSGGLTMFFAQYLVQAGVFFTVPLFLSVVLQLDALQTGLRILPLSLALLLAAAGIPKAFPHANPRRVVRFGLTSVLIGVLFLVGGMDPGAEAGVVAVPLLLIGFGLGGLASQLGSVTVSSAPDSESAEIGGLQNTATNLGASLGTALIGSVLLATLASAAIGGIQENPVPTAVRQQASVELIGGVPFLSDKQLNTALAGAGADPQTTATIVAINADARLEALRVAFGFTALLAAAALLFTGRIPKRGPGNDDNADTSSSTEATPST